MSSESAFISKLRSAITNFSSMGNSIAVMPPHPNWSGFQQQKAINAQNIANCANQCYKIIAEYQGQKASQKINYSEKLLQLTQENAKLQKKVDLQKEKNKRRKKHINDIYDLIGNFEERLSEATPQLLVLVEKGRKERKLLDQMSQMNSNKSFDDKSLASEIPEFD